MDESVREKIINFFSLTFKVRKDFWKRLNLTRRGKIIWVSSYPGVGILKEKAISLGIPLVRIIKEEILKPTSWGLIFLDREIKKNRINLDKIALREFLERGKVKLGYIEEKCEDGFVAVSFEEKIIGCAVLKNNVLYQKLPNARRKELLEILNKGY